MPTITTKTKKGSASKYYYYSHSYRVKVDSRSSGKGPGSGKSRVITEEVYLGTAEDVLQKCQGSPEPHSVIKKAFGLECAALAVAEDLDLVGIIDRNVSKRHQGLSIGEYLVIAAINRIAAPSSRKGIGDWISRTVLPERMHIDPRLLKSANFWDAFDKVVSESGHHPEVIPPVIRSIEDEVWEQLLAKYQVYLDPILYDTTNFFSYLDPLTPSQLPRYAKSKDGKANRRCVGLGLGMTSRDGFPFFHLVYSANKHDSKLFPTAIGELCHRFEEMCRTVRGSILVMDKGNNSTDNIQLALQKKMTIVGSLVPTHHLDLVKKRLTSFTGTFKGAPVYRENREVFGVPCAVVVSFNQKLQKRQVERLNAKLTKTMSLLQEAAERYRRKDSKEALERRLKNILKGSGVRKCFQIEIQGRRFKTVTITRHEEKIREKKQIAGKSLYFSTNPAQGTTEIVSLYRSRSKVEETFKLEKDPEGVPFRPMHCWTDSKIRVHAFICVLGLLIWRVMQHKIRGAGLRMSDGVLRKELKDLEEVILMYSPSRVARKISDSSTVQKELVSHLGLSRYFPKG